MNKSFAGISLLACLCLNVQTSFTQEKSKIEDSILADSSSFYHIDFSNYSRPLHQLPIGVFDSGTGGLTVLDALVNFDQHNNISKERGADGADRKSTRLNSSHVKI